MAIKINGIIKNDGYTSKPTRFILNSGVIDKTSNKLNIITNRSILRLFLDLLSITILQFLTNNYSLINHFVLPATVCLSCFTCFISHEDNLLSILLKRIRIPSISALDKGLEHFR